MLFKKTLLFSLACMAYSASAAPVHANQTDHATTPAWTGKELALYNLLSEPLEEGRNVTSYHMDATTASGYEQDGDVQAYFINCSPEWVDKIWDVTIKIWGKWDKQERENAKTCIGQMMDVIEDRCGSNMYRGNAGQCYCGAYFGDSVNGLGVKQRTLTRIVDNIDKLGVAKPGYVAETNIGDNRDERLGVAVTCTNGAGWVADKITSFSANQQTQGFTESTHVQMYGAVSRMVNN